MKRFFLTAVLLAAGLCKAQSVTLVEIIDMFGTSEVVLMSSEELRELKSEIQAETSVYPKALAAVKKAWEQDQKEAIAAGTKDYPKFIDPKLSVRKIKTRGPMSQKQGEAELEKRKIRLEREHAAQAAAEKEKLKAAKGRLTSAATNNKQDRMQAKDDLREATKERIALMITAEMEKMLERPVPKIFVVNAAAGMSEAQQKEKEKQDAKLKAARAKKEK